MKTIDKKLPAHFAGILSDLEYQILLGYVFDYFKKKDLKIRQLKEGIISLQDDKLGGGTGELALDNLIRSCKGNEERSWKEAITQHFDRLLSDGFEVADVMNDFETAKPKLTVRVYGKGIMAKEEAKNHFIWQMKIPGVYSILALNMPTRFQTIIRTDTQNWNKSDEELFEIAQNNANTQDVEIVKSPQDNLDVLAIFSNDFSATFVLDIEHNLPEAIGKLGSIVSIPTKGTAFVYAIQEATTMVFKAFELIVHQTLEFYQQDPWAITSNIYWFYEGAFYEFPRKETEKGAAYNFPPKFQAILEEEFGEES